MRMKMKLFVWNRPYGVSYGGAIAYAIAATEAEARELVMQGNISRFGNDPIADKLQAQFVKLGAPDRVCDLPYGEIYEWEE